LPGIIHMIVDIGILAEQLKSINVEPRTGGSAA